MVRHASLFSQLIALFDRQKFYQLVFRYHPERYAKRLSSQDHFVAMLFCQLAQAMSLREIALLYKIFVSLYAKIRHNISALIISVQTLVRLSLHFEWYKDNSRALIKLPTEISKIERQRIISARTHLESEKFAQIGPSAIKWALSKLV